MGPPKQSSPTLTTPEASGMVFSRDEIVRTTPYTHKDIEALPAGTSQEHQSWNGDYDPSNPLNWSSKRKWVNTGLISLQGTLSPISSTILGIGAVAIAKDFGITDPYKPALPVGLYVLGLGLGPLFLAPCSEIYGRRIVYLVCFSLFTALNAGCAIAPNITALSILRLLSGMAGSAGPSLGSSSIGDMFSLEERGRAQALCGFGAVNGPVIGGVIGGFIVYRTHDWRWLMWTIAIASAVVLIICTALLRETYGPYILSQRNQSPSDASQVKIFSADSRAIFKLSITRPLRMLFTSPICAFMSIYLALIYAILYLHLITIILLFGPIPKYNLASYHWAHGTTGLAYLGSGLGAFLGTIICGKFMNRSYAYAFNQYIKRTGSTIPVPELRLPFMQIGMAIVPVGLIIYAWSAGRTHWAVPLFGAFIFFVGLFMAYVCIQTYLVDCFGEFAASALAASIVTRCIVTCTFCIVGFQLYHKLGYTWGTMLLAFLCIAMIPIPFLFQSYGPKLRLKQFKY